LSAPLKSEGATHEASHRATRSGGLLVLGGLNVLLFATVLAQIASDDRPATQGIDWNPQVGRSVEPVTTKKPIGNYKLTLTHPVFFKARAPFVPPPSPPPHAPPKPVQPAAPVVADPGLVLGGVMANHDLRKAYLFTKANSAGSWVVEGESFMGWKIQSVDATSARLQQKDRTIELQLYPRN
jgi:hypothetical protein